MVKEGPQAAERRAGTQALVSRLLEERQQVLVLYEKVAGIEPYREEPPSAELVREFSQLLVDYIAAGHFGLYERIAAGKERRRRVTEIAEKVYSQIADTTDEVVAFNDAYDKTLASGVGGDLSHRLSRLGETIATRIELEDKIIERMID